MLKHERAVEAAAREICEGGGSECRWYECCQARPDGPVCHAQKRARAAIAAFLEAVEPSSGEHKMTDTLGAPTEDVVEAARTIAHNLADRAYACPINCAGPGETGGVVPLCICAEGGAREIAALVIAHAARLTRENNVLRGIATKIMPCHYCGADELAKCPYGFPGCALADDLFPADETQATWMADLRKRAEAAESALAAAHGRIEELMTALGRIEEGHHSDTCDTLLLDESYKCTCHVGIAHAALAGPKET